MKQLVYIFVLILVIAAVLLLNRCWFPPRPPIVTFTPTSTASATVVVMTDTPIPTFTHTVTPLIPPTSTSYPWITPDPTYTSVPPTVTPTKDYRWWNCSCQCWVDYPRLNWQPPCK